MNIEEFVSQTLNEITNGLKKSNSSNAKPFTLKKSDIVEFDMAITVIESEESSKNGKAELKIANVVGLGGGKTISENASNQSYSRINFKVTYDDDELQKIVNNKKFELEPCNLVEDSTNHL